MLQIKNICKEYKTGDLTQKALDNVSLNLRDNEFVAILGPSGSGKTTLLNIIGGLDRYDSGNLIINKISTKEYKDKDWDSYRNHTIGFVFQSYNLIPHQTILSNVELALTISGVSKNERRKKALQALKEVGLDKHYHKKPNQLSGGQMQRVAIARALVNDPDILLADEPTGALDTDTSVQVMELLKKVAKDRLVVMVTHNPELAENYATRIVNLRDGKILSDTNPYLIENEKSQNIKHRNMGKTSMSFLTSLFLSFNNLKTKKGRTILTAFAGSIGIIGIALILSLSNGVNTYIKSVEEDTLSEYPLQIQSTGFNMTSMMVGVADEEDTQNTTDDINVTNMLTNMFSKIGSNDLASLKEYLESNETNIKEYVKSIEYKYNISPQIYSSDAENLRQVNPDTSFETLGLGTASSSNSMISNMMSTDVFMQMPSNTDLFSNQYDIKAGKWPSNYNECVLVLTSKGNISDFMLYTLGLRDFKELDEMIDQFSKEENVNVPNNIGSYSYEDILGITFKLIIPTEYYEFDEEYKIWRDKSENTDYMKKIVSNAEDLKIVGIVQPKEGVSATMLSTGIYYPSSLVDYIIKKSSESQIVQEQLETPDINVFTGKKFDDSDNEDSSFDMRSLFSIDEKAIKSAFQIDQSKINIDFSNLNNVVNKVSLPPLEFNDIINKLDFSISSEQMQNLITELVAGYQEYIKNHPERDFSIIGEQLTEYLQSPEASQLLKKEIEEAIKTNGEIAITNEQMMAILTKVLDNYKQYAEENNFQDITDLNNYFLDYLSSTAAKEIISNNILKIVQSENLEEQISNIIQQYINTAMSSMTQAIEKELEASISTFSSSMANAISVDGEKFANAINIKMNEDDLTELLTSIMSKNQDTYDSNLKKLGYAEFDKPYGIDIYPKDFERKEYILDVLDEYNEKMKNAGDDDKVIYYTDMVGTLMSSVTTIINVISYVLIAFVAISLIVSSIMIGVITYISVLERKKEIGILRAIGASKRNISQVFNAETVIIGLFAGIMGIAVTLLLLIPINQIIHAIAGQNNINAILPLNAGIILVILSTVLTLIGGVIPSKKAAHEDPVLALRAE